MPLNTSIGMNLLIPFRVERKKVWLKSIFGDENISFTRISVIRVFNILLLFTFITIVIITLSIDLSIWTRFKLSNLIGSLSISETQIDPFARHNTNQDESQSGRRYKFSSQLNLLSWSTTEKPWFMINGTITPNPSDPFLSRLPIFPEEDEPWNDRIVNQLMYIPTSYNSSKLMEEGALKKILLLDKGSWGRSLPSGQNVFLQDSCPVNTCEITFDNKHATTADAIIFKDHYAKPKHVKPPNQIWILYILESPLHTPSFRSLNDVINWTASYRHDSDIVTPYEKFVYYDSDVKAHSQSTNYAKGKTKKVAWFVSNCSARNKRLQYARSLAEYIQVDIFGRCGSLKCSRTKADECFSKLDKEYKFYLSFENSNCRDYITEKFYSNGLNHSVIPITMGAHPEDYKRSAPANSFIHVDDFPSPHQLAQYLDQLDTNDTLFNQYFTWKGSGEFINTYFWCRLCAMLHAPIKPKNYDNLANWWYPSSICNSNDWL